MNRYERILSQKNKDENQDKTQEAKKQKFKNEAQQKPKNQKAEKLHVPTSQPVSQSSAPAKTDHGFTHEEAWGRVDPATGIRSAHKDPYADIYPEDSYLWVKLSLLTETELSDWYLCGILKYMRLQGTRLKPSDAYEYVLSPVIGKTYPNGWGWKSQKEYDREKDKLLNPYREKIVGLLKMLKE